MGAGHGHSHSSSLSNQRKVGAAALLTGAFMFAEVIGGVISGSLALIADAGHMLTDFASLVLAWGAIRLSRRPATWRRSFGYDRFSVLAAFVNGLSLFVIAGWICFEAVARFREPVEVLGGLMLWIALAGLAVNLLAYWILSRGGESNLNVRAATLHVMGDLLGSVAALVAAVVIIVTGWTPIDPLLSVVVAVIILRSAGAVVRDSGRILLESAPEHLRAADIRRQLMERIPAVVGVEHIHAWSITDERPMLTLEVDVATGSHLTRVRNEVKEFLREHFRVDHVTAEVAEVPPSSGSGPPRPAVPDQCHAADRSRDLQ